MRKIKDLLFTLLFFIGVVQLNAHPYVLINILDTGGSANDTFLIEVEFTNEIEFNGFVVDIDLGCFVYEYGSVALNPERRVDQEISVMHHGNNILRVMSNSNKYPPNSYNGYDGVLFSFEVILFDIFNPDSLYTLNVDTAYIISGYQTIYPNTLSGNVTIYSSKYYRLILNVNEKHGCVLGDGLYKHGDIAYIDAYPNPYYKFINWTKNGEVFSDNQFYDFEMEDDLELTANMRSIFYLKIKNFFKKIFYFF
jgi:hypothetical protein